MERWFSYIYERFPPLIYCSLALGVALSGSSLNKAGASFFVVLLAFVGLLAFLFALRLSNDIQDVAKDRIASPERPLPRGEISLGDAKQVLFFLQLLLFAYSQVLWVTLQETAALFFLLLACWAWLSDKNFYMKPLIDRAPLVQTLLNQVYVIPMVLFAVGAGQPLRVFGVKAWAFSAGLYGAMLTFRLCRTLNPHLHPIAAAYIHFYGFRKTFYLAAAGVMLSALAAGVLGVGGLLWPVQIIMLGSLLLQFFQPEQYRVAEMVGAVSLIVHAWAGIF